MHKNNWTTAAIGVILAFYFNKKSEVPPKNSKTSHGTCEGQHLSIFGNIVEIYLMRQSL
jgi:hypothetical protein